METFDQQNLLRLEILEGVHEKEHFHQDFELVFVLEGVVTVDSSMEVRTVLREKDIFLINTNRRHFLKAPETALFSRLYIPYNLLREALQSGSISFLCDSTRENGEKYAQLRDRLTKLLGRSLLTHGNMSDFEVRSLCFDILHLLTENFCQSQNLQDAAGKSSHHTERVREIDAYLSAHYADNISLADLARQLYLSEAYLSRFFKKNYGKTFIKYLNEVRLNHAIEEMALTDRPITRVAFDNGFSSVSNFYKCFRNTYGENPSAYRAKMHRKKAPEAKEETRRHEDRLEEYLQTQMVETPSDKSNEITVKCQTDAVRELKIMWNRSFNIGAAEDLLHSEVQEHVRILHNELHFHYVRFWHLFSPAMMLDLNQRSRQYNFSRLDSIIDFILEQGLTPWIDLGLKPKRLQRSAKESLVQLEREPADISLARWTDLLTEMMRHLVLRYGKNVLDDWRFELWYDERRPLSKTSCDGYLSLFRETYQIIKKFNPSTVVGGCGFRIDYPEKEALSFLKNWFSGNCPPDFFSFLMFPYDKKQGTEDVYSWRVADDKIFHHFVLYLKQLLEKAGAPRIPLYATEMNLSISDRNCLNDSCFRGAYFINNIIDLYGLVDDICYFCGSDLTSAYYESDHLLYGGTGLLTHDGIMKPAALALVFLNHLNSSFVARGANYMVTRGRDDSINIICHNQKKLSPVYYLTPEDQLDVRQYERYFENLDSLTIRFELSGLADGVYRVKTRRVNEHHGSIQALWSQLGYLDKLSRADIDYFRTVSEPKLNIEEMKVEGGKASVSIVMMPNETASLHISRIE